MSWTHLRDWTAKARVVKRCFLCGQTIGRGEPYVGRAGKDGNFFTSIAMHPECEQEARAWDAEDWECFSEGDLPRPDDDGRIER